MYTTKLKSFWTTWDLTLGCLFLFVIKNFFPLFILSAYLFYREFYLSKDRGVKIYETYNYGF